MFILKDRLFMILRLLLTSMLIFTSLTVNAEEKAMTYSQGQELIQQMNNTLAILRSWSNENDVVLDPFIGSGTTAIACIKEHRHFIGMELNKEYYDIACERIKKEQEEIKNALF